jgi:hypothetical protein
MAKKKLLNEATVRRFMGLAGMESKIVSNKLTEMYKMGEEDKDPADAEEPVGSPLPPEDEDPEAGPKMPDMDDEPEMPDMDDEPEMDDEMDDDVRELSADDVETLEMLADKLPDIVSKLQGEAGPEMDDDPAVMEEDEDLALMEDEDVLEGVELELSEDEIVQEVAKRVAKRILKAKRAKAQLDEALGRKKTR